MATARRYLPSYSVEDYLQWEGDWELFDGIAVAMTPSPFASHQDIGMRISSALFKQLEDSACDRCQVFYELDWIVDAHTVVRPDILITCGDKVEKHLRAAPTLIVEILSAATLQKDRTGKFEIYQQQGVSHYLMADPDARSLDVYHLVDGQYVKRDPAAVYRFQLDQQCQVELQTKQVFR